MGDLPRKGSAITNKKSGSIMWHNVQTWQGPQRETLAHMITRAKLAAHRTLLILGAAAILLGTSGVAAVTGWIPIPTRAALPGAQAQLAPAPEEGRARGSVSCAECAVVASKRKLAPAGAGSGGYEITVRMMDGSSRAFKDANSANWRPGQRLIFIDGAGSLAANRE